MPGCGQFNQVDPSYNTVSLKDQICDLTGIDRELVMVEYLFFRNDKKAFKIAVPHGQMQQTIATMGTEITAEPYKERNQRPTAAGQARGSRWNNTHRSLGNNHNTFRGPPTARRFPPRNQPYQHPDNFGWGPSYLQPEWQYYGPPQGGYF